MISLQEAIQSVLACDGRDTAIDPDQIIERDYGWVLFPDSREYIETGDAMKSRVGSGGTLVLKADGRHIQFGSAYGVEQNLQIYELGYLDHESWDLVVSKIVDKRKATELISGLRIQYVVPTVQFGTEWRIPQEYTRKQIKQMMRMPPVRLNVGPIYFLWESYEALKNQKYFEYHLEPNSGHHNGI